jgi:hypothetical protein
MSESEEQEAKSARKKAWYRAYLEMETPDRRAARLAKKNAWQKAYYRRNREVILARARAKPATRAAIEEQDQHRRQLLEANRERIRDRKRKWKASLSEERLIQMRERKRENGRRWRQANPDRWRQWRRTYRLKNRENNRRTYRRWYQQNREALLARKRVKYQADLERMRERGRIQRGKRRKWIAVSSVNYSDGEWRALVTAWNHRCAYCGRTPEKLQPDHRLPVSRGGSNSIENILPACPPCNFRKHTKTEEEFRALLARDEPRLGESRYGYDWQTTQGAAAA